ncbi:hypothetical protein MMC12_007252 [Toensbergia leucococca]|nr:hypothetical protein [Toensbergia leucococca]
MCIFKIRSEREEDMVPPIRPRVATSASARSPRVSIIAETRRPQSQYLEPAPRTVLVRPQSRETPRQSLQQLPQQPIIIAYSPRSSALSIREGTYQYGSGPVPSASHPSLHRQDDRRGEDGPRTSGGLTFSSNPRASSVSNRSIREKIVFLDDSGRRREYYRRE